MITMNTERSVMYSPIWHRQRFGVTATSVFASETFVLNIIGGNYEPIQYLLDVRSLR